MRKQSSAAFADSKPHYELLNGLRGVAAIMVIWYHIFEAFATSPIDQGFNHSYLAVDFFFILSGFVIGYAYDDRWKRETNRMTNKEFFKRRLIRLQPMVIMGAILGGITFCVQGGTMWDGTKVLLSMFLIALLLNLFLLPIAPGTGVDVRGNGEMYPLNGPSWTLFFEYVGNIMYALFLRRLSTNALRAVVILSGVGLASYAIFNLSGYNHLGVGWTMAEYNLLGGFLRILFSFSMGLLLTRVFKPTKIKNAFWICTAVIVVLLSMPYIGGGGEASWLNGLYDALCVIVVFPILIYLGASGRAPSKTSSRICKFLGDISYPLYMVHYPFMYLFYHWVWGNNPTTSQIWPVVLVLFFGSILLAYLCLKLYDEPVRRWLSRKFVYK